MTSAAHRRHVAIAAALLALAALAALPSQAQAPAGNTMSATGRDFEAQKVQKLGSMNADFLCERLFDSADPAAMTVELARIAGPGVLIGKFPELGGRPTAGDKKLHDDLRTLARQKVWLPPAAERRVGEWMNQKYRKEGLLTEPSQLPRTQRARFDAAKALLEGMVATLPADSPYTFTLAVTQADESNASASPGGFVYLTTGMLQDKTLDRNDLALRLAHELAHVTRRHALKELQVKMVDALEISKGVKGVLEFARDPVSGMESAFGTMQAAQLMFQRFDQVQELEADACGAYLLVRQSGVDAKAAIRRFAASRAGTGSTKGWEASHPAPEERELVMAAQVDPATRARVAGLHTGDAAARAATKDGKPAPAAAAAARTGADVQSPPPTGAATAPSRAKEALGSMFDKLRRPASGVSSGAAPGELRDPP